MEKKTMRFYPGLDVLLLGEVLAVSNKGKLAWEEIHSHVNDAIKARHMYVTLRSCKDRLRHLQDVHKRNEMSSLRASGTEEEYDERTQMLTELADLDEERKKEEGKQKCVKDEKEKQGEIIRAAAMTSLVPTKRAQNDDEKDKEMTPTKTKRRTTDSYIKYLEDKLKLEREKFDLEKKEREARLQKDNEMLKMMMTLIKK